MASTSKSTEEEHSEVYDPPTFNFKPKNDEIKQLYKNYLDVYGRIKRKAGLTSRMKGRYHSRDLFHELSADNHFCFATTFEIGRYIETVMIELLKELGDCANNLDSNYGAVNTDAEIYIIYLVGRKSHEDKCPLCKYSYIELEADRIHHYKHQHPIEKMELTKMKILFEKNGDKESASICEKYLAWPHMKTNATKLKSPPKKKTKKNVEISDTDSE
ncbi:hypothetical protein PVAND_008092 [Polypedilum vanderplanki]|uniref:Uncharacterized protein n=1 Tax=Polypedilum vanderplanki TaxID=319348 RepID=A0A9J6C8Q9_POLVA|nr:hypothetical protein PVAND_008092 [Polypedilum vanderplanki]